MGKLTIFVFALMILIGIGIAVHRGWNDTEQQERDTTGVSEKEVAGEKISVEELTSKGEKVSFDEALSKIGQANAQMKEQAEKFSIRKMIECVQKDGPAGLVAHFRGENGESHEPQIKPAALAELSGKGAQVQRAEKDNTDSVRLEIERLRKEEEAKHLQQEQAAAQTGQTPQNVQKKQGKNEKKDFLTEVREMWETFKSVVASSE